MNEMENFGWGKFTRTNDEIIIEHLALPIAFIRGYLETLFKVRFKVEGPDDSKAYILARNKRARRLREPVP